MLICYTLVYKLIPSIHIKRIKLIAACCSARYPYASERLKFDIPVYRSRIWVEFMQPDPDCTWIVQIYIMIQDFSCSYCESRYVCILNLWMHHRFKSYTVQETISHVLDLVKLQSDCWPFIMRVRFCWIV